MFDRILNMPLINLFRVHVLNRIGMGRRAVLSIKAVIKTLAKFTRENQR